MEEFAEACGQDFLAWIAEREAQNEAKKLELAQRTEQDRLERDKRLEEY